MKRWKICIYCHGELMGTCIRVTMWDVLSKLAIVRERYHKIPGWHAEAYPEIEQR